MTRIVAATLLAAYLGVLIGNIGFDLFERSYFTRGRIYTVWLARSTRRR